MSDPLFDSCQTNYVTISSCSRTKFEAITVNVLVFFMQNFRLTVLNLSHLQVSAAEFKWWKFSTKNQMKSATKLEFYFYF